jgi:ornithine cyclodeaminase/alanine dehydrogenase-like protein (mu-crystallin family)
MSAIYLTEDDVARLLDMPAAIAAVTDAFQHWADDRAENQPRRRVSGAGVMLHTMSAADAELGLAGCKVYTTTRNGASFQFHLFSSSGELLAVMSADRLGQIRTGAASGVATNFMARPDAAVVGCFGTGWQARTQLESVCAVRTIRRIEVYGRDADRRRQFAADLSSICGVEIVPVDTPEQAVQDKDIVITATSSKAPLFDGRLLADGTHLCVIGSNFLSKAEVDVATIRRAGRIVCDSIDACQLEAGDLVPALQDGSFTWSKAMELKNVVAGTAPGRTSPTEITLFKSVGLALEDLAVAAVVYREALEQNVGKPLPLDT